MAKLDISIKHNLAEEEAIKRAKSFFQTASKNFSEDLSDLKFVSNGNITEFSFKIANTRINGKLNVLKNAVNITGKIPFIFLLFKDKIEKVITEYAHKILK